MALLPVEEALARILKGAKPLAAETVPLKEALGRVLARPLKALRDQPPFDASAMDGYAVRSADTKRAPVTLRVVGEAPAGGAYPNRLREGEAVRIFTGGPLPRGADGIVIQENTERDGDTVTVRAAAIAGKHIRARGLDFRRGDVLLETPQALLARALGLAASMNHAAVPVRRKPVVAILATGDELVPPGVPPRPYQIVTSNSQALAGLVALWGGDPRDLGIARDTVSDTARALEAAAGADVLVTTGGASVGEHDVVRRTLEASGYRLGFWKIAMRPGKPLMFAGKGRQRVLGLPGNPVSALVCARLFLRPLMRALLGLDHAETLVEARLGAPLRANDERQDYLRARLGRDRTGRLVATPFMVQDSSMQRTMAAADGLIVRPPFQKPLKPGASVQVLPLDF